ncbi:helix-turn-helix domain-containing protein [Listeria aquatica]|uniref:helix-turn-helix domain-containing protein n=1 Tax=Listeria aquatica TaxID=1494960 RepID=UPI0031F571E0
MNIGFMVKQIRLDKNLTQKYTASGIMNLSHYSKFERGETTTNIENFLMILHRLNVSYEEFILKDTSEIFMLKKGLSHDFANAFTAGDTLKLSKIIEETSKILENNNELAFHHLNELATVYLSLFNNGFNLADLQGKLETIKSYLRKVNNWGIYEFVLLNNALGTFKMNEVIYFAKKTEVQLKKFAITDKCYIANAILYNASLLLLEAHRFKESHKFASISIQTAKKHANTFELIVSKITFHASAFALSLPAYHETELLKSFIALDVVDNPNFYQLIAQICCEIIPDLEMKLQNIHI